MSDRCTETGIVTGLADRNRIVVTVRRTEACQGCSARNACFALGGLAEDLALTLENTVGATPGDRVGLSLPETSIVKATAVLYFLPALGLLGGALLGGRLAAIGRIGENAISIAGALLGLAAGFAVSAIAGHKMSKHSKYTPRLSGIVSRGNFDGTRPPL